MNYFNDCTTVEAIKFTYRKLCMVHHPDRGGDTGIMQDLNSQYQSALKSVHGKSTASADGESHTYYYNEQTESQLMDVINKLITLGMVDVEVALIGTWIWLFGSSKPYKEQLKKLGCQWHSKRKCWYFHVGKSRSRSSSAGFDELGEKYGIKTFTHQAPALIH